MIDAAPLLEVEGIETCYGLSQVLFGMSLQVRAGEMVALMGRNGMGKTTTIRSIMGLTPARAGTITIAGHDVRKLPSFRIAQLGIGLVPEGRQIFPNLTVNVGLRYEMATVPSEINGKLSRLVTLTGTALHLGNPVFSNPTLRNFEPRIGLTDEAPGASARAGATTKRERRRELERP